MKLPLINRHRSWSELASAFADGSIDPAREAAFEGHMAGCAQCRQAVADTLALRASLRALPDHDVPRSFRVTPAMLAASDPLDTRPPSRLVRTANLGARLTAGVAAAALAAVFVVDFSANSGSSNDAASQLASDTGIAPEAGGGSADSALVSDESPSPAFGAPEATGTAGADGGAPPTAPPLDETPAIGAGSQPPTPAGTPEPDDAVAPGEDGGAQPVDSADRQIDDGTGDNAGGAIAELAFASAEAEEESNRDALWRGLEIALAATLVAAIGTLVLLRTRGIRA